MIERLRSLRALAVALPAVLVIALMAPGLTGCITLFPKAEPVALYRFDGSAGAGQSPAAAGRPFGLARTATAFPRASAGDRLLTITGSQAAYIADARWVSPASTLFDEAVGRSLAAYPAVRLAAMGEPGRPDYLLRLEVLAFEARYVNGAGSAPTVVVQVRASMTSARDRASAGTHIFEAQIPTSENRVTVIVAAYDQAVGQILGELRQWLSATGHAS